MNNNAKSMLVLAGDGIGPEVVAEALRVIEWFVDRRGSGGWFLRTGLGLSFGQMACSPSNFGVAAPRNRPWGAPTTEPSSLPVLYLASA